MNIDEKLDRILDLITTIADYSIDNCVLLKCVRDEIHEVREMIMENKE